MTSKRRATSVTGNIGESVLPLVAKQHLGAINPLDILPLNASSTAKSPDFRVRLHPQFPAAFRNVTGLTPNIAFNYWPAESKAVDTRGNANGSVDRAIQQLGAYWFGRHSFEPNVVGYGLVCCFIYRGTRINPLQEINFHVVAPASMSAQTSLLRRVRHHAANGGRNDFLDELKTDGSQSRRQLLDV
ncbi:hypothetical protein [Rhodopirellula baltica]|uniref:hypothetical protein n=1 Tax=Rhodopirellula baltica TaxID=265606 RepID=UPI00118192D6|nr:hypothetical protein [Rhodopirellula baltica]